MLGFRDGVLCFLAASWSVVVARERLVRVARSRTEDREDFMVGKGRWMDG